MEWHRFGNLSIERPSYYYQLLLLLLLLLLLRTKYAASQEGLMLRASRLNFWAVGGTLKVWCCCCCYYCYYYNLGLV